MNLIEFTQALEEFLASESNRFWWVDERVLWEGREEEFRHCFEDCDADLLATDVRGHAEDPNWTWWSHLKTTGEQVLYEGSWDDFQAGFDDCNADLLATELRVCATTIKAGRRRQLKLASWEGGFSG